MTSPNPPADPVVVVPREYWRTSISPRTLTDDELQDAWVAPGGEGQFAAQWEDKPHRLIYALLAHINAIQDLGSSATRIPAPANGQVASQRGVWCAEKEVGRAIYERIEKLMEGSGPAPETPEWAELDYLSYLTESVEEVGGYDGPREKVWTSADTVAEIKALYTSPTDQSSDVSSLVEALERAVRLVERDVIRVRPSDREELMDALAQWNEALAQAKRSGDCGEKTRRIAEAVRAAEGRLKGDAR